jgi:sulfite reductase beta subunit-like hemoprotein
LSIDPQKVRIEGIYQQRQEGFFMQRVKLPAGVVSAGQAECIAAVAERFGRGTIHLTSRGSMEIHWLKGEDLPLVKQELAKYGLTSRGACGGAVRGISCSSQDAARFPLLESVARKIHRHFTGNPRFEGLPKKFKIGIEADTISGRHLIQDVGLVLSGDDNGAALYDIYIAGGLGREPQAGFLLVGNIPEERLITIIEAVVTVYARLAPPPKRLKFLASEFGEEELIRLIKAEAAFSEELQDRGGFSENLSRPRDGRQRLLLPVFAGQLTADELREVAAFSAVHSDGLLQVTAEQDLAFPLSAASADQVETALTAVPQKLSQTVPPVTFRICPGNHECKMGLTATRDLAKTLIDAMPEEAKGLVWALSGCGNSCTQPHLADVGIVSVKLVASEQGGKEPRFDLYRRNGTGFGEKLCKELTIGELVEEIRRV